MGRKRILVRPQKYGLEGFTVLRRPKELECYFAALCLRVLGYDSVTMR